MNLATQVTRTSPYPKYVLPLFVEDQETNNNTDELVNVNMETNIESGTYFFSSAQEPSDTTSVQ
jgi:hypothetical protein